MIISPPKKKKEKKIPQWLQILLIDRMQILVVPKSGFCLESLVEIIK